MSGGLTDYNVGYLDEQTGADDTTNAVSIRSFFAAVAGVRTTTRTDEATVIQTRHRIPETPLADGQTIVYQVPVPDPLRLLEPRETETRRLNALGDYELMCVKRSSRPRCSPPARPTPAASASSWARPTSSAAAASPATSPPPNCSGWDCCTSSPPTTCHRARCRPCSSSPPTARSGSPTARLVSGNPARAVGLNDRGEIAVGQRADLVRVQPHELPATELHPHGRLVPVVRRVYWQGERVS